jgi:hypothetical protein
MIRVASIEVNPAPCRLSVFLEILWLTFVQNVQNSSMSYNDIKLEVIWYAQEHRNQAAEIETDVGDTNIRWWSGEKENLEGISKEKCTPCGKMCKYLHVEVELYQNIMNMWKNRFTY